MISKRHARRIRAEIEKHAATLDDSDALEVPEMFAKWRESAAYEAGDRVRHGSVLYTCIQAHTSQAGWTPDVTPALWKVTAPEGTVPEWVQPTGAHDAYAKGDKVMHNGSTWVSTIDANVYEPGVYGWEMVE